MPSKKRIDWNAIRAEYIAGGIGQRKLAKKYGVSEGTLIQKARTERWVDQRQQAYNDYITKTIQKTASAASDNAATAQRIKAKLLARLEREIDNIPEAQIGTAYFQQTEKTSFDQKSGKPVKRRSGIEYKLRDLAAAYKDLTADMQLEDMTSGNALLQSLYELEQERGE